MPVQQPIITDIGKSALINSNNSGFDLELTHVGFGTSNFTPSGTETEASDEIKRVGISGSVNISPTSFQIMANAQADKRGAAWITSLYFYAGEVLFAVYSEAEGNIFYLSERHTSTINYMLDVSSLPDSSIAIKIDAEAAASLKLIGEQSQIIKDSLLYDLKIEMNLLRAPFEDLEICAVGGRNIAGKATCWEVGAKRICAVGGRDATKSPQCHNMFQQA